MSILILQQPSSSGGGGGSNLQSGSQAISNGSDSVSVTFGTPFASAPSVVVSVSRTSGDFILGANVVQGSISTTGFTVQLSAAAPDANYVLNWMANV